MTTLLDDAQRDRAAGVLLGQACGDAFGAPYEYSWLPIVDGDILMRGADPGEWTDDTALAICIAQWLTQRGSATPEGFDVAKNFIARDFFTWREEDGRGIGRQTRRVMDEMSKNPDWELAPAASMTAEAADYKRRNTTNAAGNGALMRTSVMGLYCLGDDVWANRATLEIAALTHCDPLVDQSCILMVEAIRHAVRTGELDIRRGLARLDADVAAGWSEKIALAQTIRMPRDYKATNGFTVDTLLAAWSAISHTDNVNGAIFAAVDGRGDTDTVAAVTGALAGARDGSEALRGDWVEQIHGYPDWSSETLVLAAIRVASQGC